MQMAVEFHGVVNKICLYVSTQMKPIKRFDEIL